MCLLVCAEKGKAARKTAPAGAQKTRVRQMEEGDIRGQWTSWDKELVQVLPAEVQQQFPVVLNGGIAVHKPLFEDLQAGGPLKSGCAATCSISTTCITRAC